MMLRLSLWASILVSCAALNGCGSSVDIPAGSGGMSSSTTRSSTGGTSTGGTSTGGTSTGGPCPADMPEEGTPCGETFVVCSFGPGKCCAPESKACMNGVWSHVYVDCAAIFCPADPPEAGAKCCPSTDSSMCTYGTCDGSDTVTHAGCSLEGQWEVSVDSCVPVDCGGKTCDAGMVCVETVGGAGFTYACQPDPCPMGALSCACAASLCGGPPFECTTSPGLVNCTCPVCP